MSEPSTTTSTNPIKTDQINSITDKLSKLTESLMTPLTSAAKSIADPIEASAKQVLSTAASTASSATPVSETDLLEKCILSCVASKNALILGKNSSEKNQIIINALNNVLAKTKLGDGLGNYGVSSNASTPPPAPTSSPSIPPFQTKGGTYKRRTNKHRKLKKTRRNRHPRH